MFNILIAAFTTLRQVPQHAIVNYPPALLGFQHLDFKTGCRPFLTETAHQRGIRIPCERRRSLSGVLLLVERLRLLYKRFCTRQDVQPTVRRSEMQRCLCGFKSSVRELNKQGVARLIRSIEKQAAGTLESRSYVNYQHNSRYANVTSLHRYP